MSKDQSLLNRNQAAEKLGIPKGTLHLAAIRAGVKPIQKIIQGRTTNFYTEQHIQQIRKSLGKES